MQFVGDVMYVYVNTFFDNLLCVKPHNTNNMSEITLLSRIVKVSFIGKLMFQVLRAKRNTANSAVFIWRPRSLDKRARSAALDDNKKVFFFSNSKPQCTV